eukprot:1117799-Pyramimonas_sp.AAC.1
MQYGHHLRSHLLQEAKAFWEVPLGPSVQLDLCADDAGPAARGALTQALKRSQGWGGCGAPRHDYRLRSRGLARQGHLGCWFPPSRTPPRAAA